MEITLEVKGLLELQRANEKVVKEIADSGNLIAKAAYVIERQAKENASGRPGPKVQTGRLRASITTEIVSSTQAKVGTNVTYAPMVEFGHAQEVGRFVPLFGARTLVRGEFAGRYEGIGLGLRLVNPRAPAYPFLGPTIEQTKDKIQGVMVSFGESLGAEWNE